MTQTVPELLHNTFLKVGSRVAGEDAELSMAVCRLNELQVFIWAACCKRGRSHTVHDMEHNYKIPKIPAGLPS